MPFATGRPVGRPVSWCIRPELVQVSREATGAVDEVPARLLDVALAGTHYRCRAEVPEAGVVEASVEAMAAERAGLSPGDAVWLRLTAPHLFPDL